jgi:hypothetical protein
VLKENDQVEWPIEWQTALAGAHPALVGAGLGLCSSWSGGVTRKKGTARLFMVRRRSTVRFRKGALVRGRFDPMGAKWSAVPAV